MNEYERKIWLDQMTQAAERRARAEVGHRHVVASARMVRVEHARLPESKPQVTAHPPPVSAAPKGAPISWRAMLDGFELTIYAPLRQSRLFVPEHLTTTSDDRAWRRWEVP